MGARPLLGGLFKLHPSPDKQRMVSWIRLGAATTTVIYSILIAYAVVVMGRPLTERMSDTAAAIAAAVALFLARRKPSGAAFLVLGALWAETTYASITSGRVSATAAMVYPIVVVMTGFLVSGRAAVVAALTTAIALPASFVLWGPSDHLTELGYDLLGLPLIVIASAVLTQTALSSYHAALRSTDEARRRYEDLFQHAPDGLVVVNDDGQIDSVNDAARRLLGRDQEVRVGTWLDAFLPSWRTVLDDDAGETPPILLVPGSEPRAIEISHRTGLGGEARILLTLRDVTERLAMEKERARWEEQHRRTQRLESLGELAGGVAHEFNNLFTVIAGTADLLVTHDDPEVRQLSADIVVAQDRGAALVRQMLTFARREFHRPEPLDMGRATRSIQTLLSRILGDRHTLDLRIHREVGVLADQAQLEQLVLALVSNARDALPDGGEVRVVVNTVEREVAQLHGSELDDPNQALLEVSDSGVGMDEATVARAFEPFFTTKPTGSGIGLGLSAVHGIVTQSKGHVVVRSKPGRGTTVSVFLPLVDVPDTAPPPRRMVSGAPIVLLAEDDPLVCALVERVLTHSGFDVRACSSGDEACEVATGLPTVDLLVTDVMMPGLTGPDLAAHLRAQNRDLKVLYISGYTELSGAKGLDVDPEALLPKPFSPGQLVERVERALKGLG